MALEDHAVGGRSMTRDRPYRHDYWLGGDRSTDVPPMTARND